VVSYTQEGAEYAEKLQEEDERTRDAPLDVVERELERVRASMESAPARAVNKGTRLQLHVVLEPDGAATMRLIA
jgi:hypothetical protein